MPENNYLINEDNRLAKLFYYEILDSPSDKTFENICALAASILNVNDAGICFIAENEVFTKAYMGKKLALKRTDAPILSVLHEASNHIENDGDFYVVVPIKSPDDFIIGALYGFGSKLIEPTTQQYKMLSNLAALIMDKLETRIAIRKTLTAQDDRLHVLIHDLKNPMTTISLQSELVSRMPNIDEKAIMIASKINLQSKRMVNSLNDILSSAKKVTGSFKPQKNKVNLTAILKSVVQKLKPITQKKRQNIHIQIDTPLEIFADEDKISALFYQILHNAIKFSPLNKTTTISHKTEENLITISIKDQGVGLTELDLERLFIKFAELSAAPTQAENSNGLGLTLVKMLVDMHKGKLWAASDGKNEGTTFYVQLPIK